MSDMHRSVMTGIGSLNNFGNVLSSLLDSFDQQLLRSNESSTIIMKDVSSLQVEMKTYDLRMRRLEAETEEQRKIVENAMKQLLGIEKTVDVALADATRHLHKEILAQRTMTKMDISQLRGKVHHSMSEAMALLTENQSRTGTGPLPSLGEGIGEGGPPGSTADRLQKLEEALSLQHSMTKHLSGHGATQTMVQSVYDQLYEEVSAQHAETAKLQTENKALRRLIADMRTTQDWQNQQIVDLLSALNDKTKMQSLRVQIAEGMREQPQFLPDKIFLDADEAKEDAARQRHARHSGRQDDRARKRSAQRRRRATRRAHQQAHQQADGDEEGGAEGGAEETGDEADPGADREHSHKQEVEPVAEQDTEEVRRLRRELRQTRRQERQDRPDSASELEMEGAEAAVERAPRPKKQTARPPSQRREEQGQEEQAQEAQETGEQREGDFGDVDPLGAGSHDTDDNSSFFMEDGASLLSFMIDTDPLAQAQLSSAEVTELRERVAALEHQRALHEAQLEALAAQTQDQTQHLGEHDTALQTMKRLAFVFDDLKTHFEVVKGKVDRFSGGESLDEQAAQSLGAKLRALVKHYTHVYAELCFALENGDFTLEGNRRVEDLKGHSNHLGDDDPASGALRGATAKHSTATASAAPAKPLREDEDSVDEGPTQTQTQPQTQTSQAESAGSGLLSELLPGGTHTASGLQQHSFFSQAFDLARLLEGLLSAAAAQDLSQGAPAASVHHSLHALAPQIHKVYDLSLNLMVQDEAARAAESLESCFDDLVCSDLTPSLRGYVRDGSVLCLPLLDATLHLSLLSKQVQSLSKSLQRKAEAITLVEHESLVRNLLFQKLDASEFRGHLGKLASLQELQRVQSQVLELKATGGTSLGGSAQYLHSQQTQMAMQPRLFRGGAAGAGGELDEEMQALLAEEDLSLRALPSFQDMQQKTESLISLVRDLQHLTDKHVDKQEVAEALKALILEIKGLRRNTVQPQLMTEALKKKADVAEVDKLFKQLALVLGDSALATASTDIASLPPGAAAAAFHAKCLLCDKPVTDPRLLGHLTARAKTPSTTNPNSRVTSAVTVSRSTPALHLSEHEGLPALRPASTQQSRLTSSAQQNRLMGNVPQSDRPTSSQQHPHSLPPLMASYTGVPSPMAMTDTLDSPLGSQSTAAEHDNNKVASINYRNRLRASAGGGLGPSYAKDTR